MSPTVATGNGLSFRLDIHTIFVLLAAILILTATCLVWFCCENFFRYCIYILNGRVSNPFLFVDFSILVKVSRTIKFIQKTDKPTCTTSEDMINKKNCSTVMDVVDAQTSEKKLDEAVAVEPQPLTSPMAREIQKKISFVSTPSLPTPARYYPEQGEAVFSNASLQLLSDPTASTSNLEKYATTHSTGSSCPSLPKFSDNNSNRNNNDHHLQMNNRRQQSLEIFSASSPLPRKVINHSCRCSSTQLPSIILTSDIVDVVPQLEAHHGEVCRNEDGYISNDAMNIVIKSHSSMHIHESVFGNSSLLFHSPPSSFDQGLDNHAEAADNLCCGKGNHTRRISGVWAVSSTARIRNAIPTDNSSGCPSSPTPSIVFGLKSPFNRAVSSHTELMRRKQDLLLLQRIVIRNCLINILLNMILIISVATWFAYHLVFGETNNDLPYPVLLLGGLTFTTLNPGFAILLDQNLRRRMLKAVYRVIKGQSAANAGNDGAPRSSIACS